MNKTNIRASMLPSWFDCSRRAAAGQFRKEIEAAGFPLRDLQPSVGSALGTAVHAGAEHLLRIKMESGQVGSIDGAVGVAHDRFGEETQTGAEWDDTTPNPNVAHFQIGRLVASYAAFAERVAPKAVELELAADAGDGFELTGHIDLYTHDRDVRDLKTGALHRPYQSQLGAYSLLVRANGEEVRGVAIDWIARAPKTKPQPPVQTESYPLTTCEKAAWATVQRIKNDLTQFRETGDPWSFAANPMTMMCGAKFCPAHGTAFCDMHLKGKK